MLKMCVGFEDMGGGGEFVVAEFRIRMVLCFTVYVKFEYFNWLEKQKKNVDRTTDDSSTIRGPTKATS